MIAWYAQAPQRLRAWIVAPGFGSERIGPSSVPAVCPDLQSQPPECVDHPLVFIEGLYFRISFDHWFEQLGRTAPFSSFRIGWNRDVALLHQSEHGGTFEHAAEINFSAELAVESLPHLRRDGRGMPLRPPVERHIDRHTAPAHLF